MIKLKERVRGGLVALATLVVALLLGATLSGCGPSDEEAITQIIDNEMSVFVDVTDEEITVLADDLASVGGSTFNTMGIDTAELVRVWIDGFGYEVGPITVDGETATADVVVTCKQFGPAMMEWQDEFTENVSSQGFTSMSEVYSYAGQTIMEKIQSVETTETTVTLEFEKSGSDWVMTESSAQSVVSDAMIGDYSL